MFKYLKSDSNRTFVETVDAARNKNIFQNNFPQKQTIRDSATEIKFAILHIRCEAFNYFLSIFDDKIGGEHASVSNTRLTKGSRKKTKNTIGNSERTWLMSNALEHSEKTFVLMPRLKTHLTWSH